MSVQVTREALRRFLKKALFEQVDEPSGRNVSSDDSLEGFRTTGEDDTMIPDEVPVSPSDQMAVQLTQERPPIEDEDFIPSSPVELAQAADAWGRLVPDEQVEYFYQKLKLVYDATLEKHNMPEEEDIDVEEEEPISKNEVVIRRRVLKSVRKILEQSSIEDEYDEYRGAGRLADDDIADELVPPSPDLSGVGLEDLASQFGYGGASGVRQDLERIFKRLGFTVENITDEQLDAVRSFAQDEFIGELLAQEFIDESDALELRENPNEVSDLDSFRFFFVSGFMLPAYQKVLRDARKRVDVEIGGLGLPRKTKQTVLNQALGDTPRNMKKLTSKLLRDAQAEGVSDDAANAMLQKVISAMPSLFKLGKIEGDLVATAMDIWHRASVGKKKAIMSKALQATAEFQDNP